MVSEESTILEDQILSALILVSIVNICHKVYFSGVRSVILLNARFGWSVGSFSVFK